MHRVALLALSSVVTASFCLAQGNPFLGRWDFNMDTPGGRHATWLGITEKDGKPEVWFQPTGGHVYQVDDFTLKGSHLTLQLAKAADKHPALVWELDARNGKLTGVQKRGDQTLQLTGVRAPELNRKAPKAWSDPEPLFDGKDLNGWEPIGDTAHNNWVVEDGLLINKAHGANLESTRKFEDYKVHFEVNCPDKANSGFYQRGRYELQLEYEPEGTEPPERRMGAIYGRIAPSVELPRKPGQWESFDVTLVGRTISVVRDGTPTIDHKVIEGITGGALDANEAEPGPFYIQGDHTGGLKFRNITVQVPKR